MAGLAHSRWNFAQRPHTARISCGKQIFVGLCVADKAADNSAALLDVTYVFGAVIADKYSLLLLPLTC